MTTRTAPSATALYDIPGPATRKRHLLYGIVSTALILALLGWVVYLLFDTEQFTSAKWTPFTYKGIQELLLRGLGNTLKAFAYAAVLSLLLGAILAVGGSPITGRCAGSRRCSWSSSGPCPYW